MVVNKTNSFQDLAQKLNIGV